jgi:antitoxin component YwqK of YwqJK toxin-antitoxin module
MRTSLILLSLCLFGSLALRSQNIGDHYPSSREVIEEGIKYNDDGKYDQAIASYQKVHPCDSLYYLAIYEIALSHANNKEYDKTVAYCKKGLTLESSEERGFYDLLGSAYDYLEKQDSALYYYQQGLKKFPHYGKFYFEMGVSYVGKKNDSAAYRYFIKSAELNPLHAGTQLQLANLAMRNGYYTAAALAYQYFLIIENSTPRALNALSELEKLCNNNFTVVAKPFNLSKDGNNFSEMDEILKSRAAQISSYKSKVKLSYTDITKQCQILSEKFTYDESDKGFFNRFYGRFFSQAWKNDFYEASMYVIFSGLQDDKVQSLVKKNEKNIDAFTKFMFNVIDDYRKNIKHKIDGKEVDGQRYFYNNGNIEAVGNTNGAVKTGKWYVYNKTGYITSVGNYLNDEPDGIWTNYYTNGKKRSEVTWSNAKRNGPYSLYHENGLLKEKGTYVNNEIEGEVITYASNGALKDVAMYKKGQQHGAYTLYDNQGIKSATATYENNKVTGKVLNYFHNGVVSEERDFKNGEVEGPTKSYFNNGKTNYTGSYKNGKRDGMWVWYYRNGNKSREGFYNEGTGVKTWTDYYEDGRVKEVFNYNNDGLTDGEFKLYTGGGVLYSDGTYKNNKLTRLVYYDKDKKVLYETKNRDKDYEFKKYYVNGVIDEEGSVKDNQREGRYTHNYINGAKGSEIGYKAGKYDGNYIKYFYNGKVDEQYHCTNDNYDGYFKQYYVEGGLKAEGYYKDGSFEGPYTSYYRDGTVKEKFYYMNNSATGYGDYFDAKGKLRRRDYYSDIVIVKTELYDTLGKVFQTLDNPSGSTTLTIMYPNKTKDEEYNLVFGKRHGKYTKYYPNGKVKETAEYFYGDLNGECKYYDINGKLTRTATYKYDIQVGAENWYDEEGKLDFVMNFNEGDLHGKKTWYYPNGKVHLEKFYKYGSIDSTSTFYSDDGTMALQIRYENEIMVAYTYLDKTGKPMPWQDFKNETAKITSYYPNGKKAREVNYVYSLIQGKRTMYYTNGNMYLDADFIDDMRTGISKEYYPTGTLMEEATYKHDELNGLKKVFYDNGTLRSECYYVNDVKYGPEKFYDKTGKLIGSYYNIDGDTFVK